MPTLEQIVGIVPANFNMLKWGAFSQATDFSTYFTLTSATVSTGIVDPAGQTNAQKLIENSGGGTHLVYDFNSAQCNASVQTIFRVGVIAKAAERTRIVIASEIFIHEAVVSASVGFDLAGGNVGYDTAVGSETTLVAYAMTDFGDGWWLCTFDYQYNGSTQTSGTIQPKIYLDNGSGTGARSVNYTGDGSSGVNLFWLNLLPVGAWGHWNTVFSDDFSSTNSIDLANTLDPGFNWYINNAAPNAPEPTWWQPAGLPPSLPGNFVISSPSVLKMFDASGASGQWQTMMYSVAFPDAGGYIGSAWSAPVILDGYFSWDNSIHKTAAFWSHMVEKMAGTIPIGSHWLEWDWVDIGATLSSINDEYVSSDVPNSVNRSATWSQPPYTMAPDVFNRLSGMWLSKAQNQNSCGTFMSFFNGQFVFHSDVAYNDTDNFPAIVDANQVPLSQFEASHICIMIDQQNGVTNGGGPTFVDWVRVYQPGEHAATDERTTLSMLGTRAGARQMIA